MAIPTEVPPAGMEAQNKPSGEAGPAVSRATLSGLWARLRQREWRTWLLALAAWIGLWLLESVRTAFLIPGPDAPGLSFERSLIINLPWWSTWAALTPLIVWLASRIQLDG